MLKIPVKRLDALTSLRFFAAAMIVVHHSRGEFGLSQQLFQGVFLGQAVSFFFVLSGFILAYAYREMSNAKDIKRFFVARVARLWPAHIATFLIVLLFFRSYDWDITLANLLMVQAWVPLPNYFFSYNMVSWSISTEFFFYFMFVFIFLFLKGRAFLTLALALGLAACAVFFANQLNLPMYQHGKNVVSIDAIVHIHPIARLFEFTFGMYVFTLWGQYSNRINIGRAGGTLIEGAALLAAVIGIYYIPHIAFYYQHEIGMATVKWLTSTGCFLLFGVLVFFMALDKGLISKFLSLPLLVVLGEISYAMYLVHTILIRVYQQHAEMLSVLPTWVLYPVFWLSLLVISHLIWYVIERPGRKLIINLFPYESSARTPLIESLKGASALLTPDKNKPLSLRNLKVSWLLLEIFLLIGLFLSFIFILG